MHSATSSANAKRAKTKSHDFGQFDLFAIAAPQQIAVAVSALASLNVHSEGMVRAVTQPEPVRASVVALQPPATKQTVRSNGRERPTRIFIIEEGDLPKYSEAEKAIVDRTMEALPEAKAWFTYGDIKQAFSISRATVVRRVKSGVVPGIRFAGDRVLEDGNIRRFTREQIRYLLLAVRRSVSKA